VSEEAGRVVVVGASAAGLRCACRLARLQPHRPVTVVEARKTFSYAACGLPYVLSGDIDELASLRRTTYGIVRDTAYFTRYKGIELLAGHRATGIDPARRLLRLEGPEGETELAWDDLVLATGARPLRLPGQPDHPRVRGFHHWDDVAPLKQGLMRGEIGHVALVGAGPVGCELAEAFRGLWGAEVTLIEAAEAPLPGLLDREVGSCVARGLEEAGVRLLCGSPVERVEAGEEGVAILAGGTEVHADAAVVAIGVEPAAELAAEAGAALGPTGAVSVDERLATTLEGIWAVGDCTECRHVVTGEPVSLPLGSLANRQGRTLANVLAGREDAFPPVAGAMAVKVLDCNVAAVGLSAARARAEGLEVRSAWLTGEDRADYWPDSKALYLKLVYERESLRVLGLQAVGPGECAKRVDVATQIITRGGTLQDLARLEHAYAPPFAPALDPLAVLAYAAQNQEEGVASEVPLRGVEAATVLDVRLPEEREREPVEAGEVIPIPLDQLRSRAGDLGEGPWLVLCERGTRSAEAVRILRHAGAEAGYLGGGMQWRAACRGEGS
jgi:NADPH-dependent 2,4-dienoyl-CoA reductase/sulfur reductase-like enzyme/rhodanese-related sulfurtransferase